MIKNVFINMMQTDLFNCIPESLIVGLMQMWHTVWFTVTIKLHF